MMRYLINCEAFNAVIACSGIEDTRFCLNSFLVDTTNSALIATNGHVLAKVPLERLDQPGDPCSPETHGDFQGFLFARLAKPIPKNRGDFVTIDGEQGTLCFSKAKEMQLERMNGVFPDYLRIIAKPGEPITPASEIGLNPEYLAKPARWAGYNYAKTYMEFRGERSGILVTYGEPGLKKVEITLMPIHRR